MLAELGQHAWQHKLGGVVACTLASALYLRLAGGRLPTPATRLAVAAAPVCALNAVLPLLFCRQTEAVTIAFVAFLLTWLGSFKALAWAGGRGRSRGLPAGAAGLGGSPALSLLARISAACACPTHILPHCCCRAGPLAQHAWSPLQFWALYALPILPSSVSGAAQQQRRQRLDSGPGSSRHLLLRWLLKLGAAAAVVFALQHEELLPPFAKTCLCSVGIYAMLGECEPHSRGILPLAAPAACRWQHAHGVVG